MAPSSSTSTEAKGKVVAPDYIRGFNHLKKECILGFIALSALYFILLIPGSYLIPSDKFCPVNEPCKRPDLFAFECINALVFLILSITSIKSWYIRKDTQTKLTTTVGRVYGYCPQSEKVAAISFTFQLWSVVFTTSIPEFFSTIMMSHHIMAALTSFLALQYQTYHYYIMVFLALSEVSSLPLVLISMGKYFPSYFEFVKPVAEPLFAVLFVYYRIYVWNKISWLLWKDSIVVLGDGKKLANDYRPGKSFVLYVILSLDVVLGLLQLFWFTFILAEVMKMLGIDVIDFNPGFE